MKILLIGGLSVIYTLLHTVNNFLTDQLYLVKAAHLVHLPSGIKLFYVLIFGWAGVVALFISNLYLSMLGILKDQFLLIFLSAFITAVSPLVAMKYIKCFQNIEEDYYQLSAKNLFNISVLYSLLNSVCIQLVIHLGDPSTSLVHEIFVMFIGDMTGIALLAFFFVVVYKLFLLDKKID